MSSAFNSNIYVCLNEDRKFHPPYPSDMGFDEDYAYKIYGVFNYDSTSVAQFLLFNKLGQPVFVENRHFLFFAEFKSDRPCILKADFE